MPVPGHGLGGLAQRGLAVGLIIHDDGNVRFTAPGTGSAQVMAAMAAMDLDVSVRDDLGSVSVVSAMVVNRSDVTATVLSALETSGIHAHLITCMPNRVSCHVLADDVGRAAQALHDAFQLHAGEESIPGSSATETSRTGPVASFLGAAWRPCGPEPRHHVFSPTLRHGRRRPPGSARASH